MSFTHIPSGMTFDNRKQAVKVMGQKRYRKELFNKNFEFEQFYRRDKKNNTKL